jgi:hypothetical protein
MASDDFDQPKGSGNNHRDVIFFLDRSGGNIKTYDITKKTHDYSLDWLGDHLQN